MQDIELRKYSPINPILKKLIKFYWIIKSNKETDVYGKLIPTNNIDLIINLSSPIKYKNQIKEETFQNSHFSGIQKKYRIIQHKGIVDVIGISFYPTGFYPFVKVPLSEFTDRIVLAETFLKKLEAKVEKVSEIESDHERILVIERTLLAYIDLNLLPEKKIDLLANDLLMYGDSTSINNYCKTHGISQKTLERFFNKYVGTTPKAFFLTTKFQKLMKSLVMGNSDSMTEIGYEFNYYDQTHFINSFKSFMGNTPAKQLKEKDLILEYLHKV